MNQASLAADPNADDRERQVAPPEGLRRLQEEFGRAARAPLSFAGGRMRSLPDAYPESATDAVRPRGRQTPRERLAIYNEQYWYRLLTVLQENFPLLARTLGFWEFNQLATEYLIAHPSRDPSLDGLAWNLPAFLRGNRRFATPRNLQIAAVDLAALRAFHAPARENFDPGRLSPQEAAALESMPMELQPWLSLVEEDWNLTACRQAVLEGTGSAPEFREAKGYWVAYRHEGAVAWGALEPAAFLLLSALAAGETLAEACESVDRALPDAEAERFAGNLAAWFAEWTSLGWFAQPAFNIIRPCPTPEASFGPSTWNTSLS